MDTRRLVSGGVTTGLRLSRGVSDRGYAVARRLLTRLHVAAPADVPPPGRRT